METVNYSPCSYKTVDMTESVRTWCFVCLCVCCFEQDNFCGHSGQLFVFVEICTRMSINPRPLTVSQIREHLFVRDSWMTYSLLRRSENLTCRHLPWFSVREYFECKIFLRDLFTTKSVTSTFFVLRLKVSDKLVYPLLLKLNVRTPGVH